MAAIPAFKYCSWYSKACGNTTDETDLKWHSNLSSLSDQLRHFCWDTDIRGFHSPGHPFSLPGRTAPKQRSICTSYKNIVGFSSPLSKLSFQSLCAAQHRFLQVHPVVPERHVAPATHTYTRVRTEHRQSCIVLEEVLDLSLAHGHKGTMAKLKAIGHVVC